MKRILTGTPAESAAAKGALANPESLTAFEELARRAARRRWRCPDGGGCRPDRRQLDFRPERFNWWHRVRSPEGGRGPCASTCGLTITDTLSVLVDGGPAFNPLAKVTRTFWYRVPPDWVRRRPARPGAAATSVLDQLYGPGWRHRQRRRFPLRDPGDCRSRSLTAGRGAGPAVAEPTGRRSTPGATGDVLAEVIPAQL